MTTGGDLILEMKYIGPRQIKGTLNVFLSWCLSTKVILSLYISRLHVAIYQHSRYGNFLYLHLYITREKLYNIDECIANMYSIDHAEFIIGSKLLLEISEVYSGASEKRTLQDIASVRSSLSRRLFCIKIINLCISECPLLGGSVNRGSTV